MGAGIQSETKMHKKQTFFERINAGRGGEGRGGGFYYW